MAPDVRRAIAARDAAAARVRRLTAGAVAVGLALTAAFAALAAGSTHFRKVVVHRARVAPAAKAPPVRAPAPPLVAVRSDAPAPAPPASAPAPAPMATSQPPVVVSGGS